MKNNYYLKWIILLKRLFKNYYFQFFSASLCSSNVHHKCCLVRQLSGVWDAANVFNVYKCFKISSIEYLLRSEWAHYRRNSSQACLVNCATTLLLQERQSAWCERTGQWRVNHYRCLWGDGDVNPKPCDTLINHSADRNKHTLFHRQPNKTAFSASKQRLQRERAERRGCAVCRWSRL